MKPSARLITLLTILVVLFAVNFFIARHPLRWDLTDGDIYTLSSSTKKVLHNLSDVVTVRVYFSNELPPQLSALRRDVDDMLAEYKRAASDKISIEHIDPTATPGDEQKVAMLGIPPVQLNVFNKDKQEVAKIYLGMAILYAGKQQVIPVITDTGNLEYQITEAILMVTASELPQIAWFEGKVPDQQGESDFRYMREALSRRYQITPIDAAKTPELDPTKVKALVLASPREIHEEFARAIDTYLMQGGNVIALIDRLDVTQQLKLAAAEGNVAKIFQDYGATVEESLIADASSAMAAFAGGVVTYHVPYAFWPEVRNDGFNHDEPITTGLQSLVFPWTSPLILSAQGHAVALSSLDSTVAAGTEHSLAPQEANTVLKSGTGSRQVIAAIIDGPFTSRFGSTPDTTTSAPATPPGRIFITGSSRWISDRFLPQFPQNAALFQNAVDAFAMGDALIGIRSREVTTRPIAIMPEEVMAAIRLLNIAAGPVILAIIAGVLWFLRRQRRRYLMTLYRDVPSN